MINWNVRNPSPGRAAAQVDWLIGSGADTIVLTELKASSAGLALLREGLASASYSTHVPRADPGDYVVLIADRHGSAEDVALPVHVDPQRVCGVTVNSAVGKTFVMGVYVPSRGPASARNEAKRRFQEHLASQLVHLARRPDADHVVIAGDLNVVERNHVPRHAVFGDWEYSFYEEFERHDLVDAFHVASAGAMDHSWFGRSGAGYRFDHSFVSRSLRSRVVACEYVHAVRHDGLSDHSAMRLVLQEGADA